MLRGEVLARWQDFVGTGEFFRSLESGIGRLRDRIGAFFTGKPKPVDNVEAAIESGLHAVVVDQAAKASETVEERWRADPAGKALVGTANLGALSDGFSDRVAEQVRAWQGDLMGIIRTEGANKRMTARMVSFGVNGVAVALMVVVFASTAGLTGLEVGIAGGSAVVGQKLLEAIFGEDAVRTAHQAGQGFPGNSVHRPSRDGKGSFPFPPPRDSNHARRQPHETKFGGHSPTGPGARCMSRRRQSTTTSPLELRLEALKEATELGADRVEAAVSDASWEVLERASTRRTLSAEHTVVGFFGATGSGKSSLFNAVAGVGHCARGRDQAHHQPTARRHLGEWRLRAIA